MPVAQGPASSFARQSLTLDMPRDLLPHRASDRGVVRTENMPKKMLIDATHAEETRVVVVDGNKVEEFDFESQFKRQPSIWPK